MSTVVEFAFGLTGNLPVDCLVVMVIGGGGGFGFREFVGGLEVIMVFGGGGGLNVRGFVGGLESLPRSAKSEISGEKGLDVVDVDGVIEVGAGCVRADRI